MTDFQMGLVVSAIGLSVTFLALLVFIGVIILLQKIFPPKKEQKEDAVEATASIAEISASNSNSDEALAAALAAAAYIRSRRSGQLGASLLVGPGPYRTSR